MNDQPQMNQGWKSIFTPISEAIRTRDWGQILIFMAVAVGLPRWAGAMLSADGLRVYEGSTGPLGYLYWFLVILFGLSSFGMAMLEVFAIGYVFDALRARKPFTTSGKWDIRWWGSLIFGIVLLIMMPVILAPNMLANLNHKDIVTYLADPAQQGFWIVTVILAPTIIIGGVSFARDGMVGTTNADKPAQNAPRRAQVVQETSQQTPPESQSIPTPEDSPEQTVEPPSQDPAQENSQVEYPNTEGMSQAEKKRARARERARKRREEQQKASPNPNKKKQTAAPSA